MIRSFGSKTLNECSGWKWYDSDVNVRWTISLHSSQCAIIYFWARDNSGSRMFGYLCLINEWRIAISIVSGSQIRSNKRSVFPNLFIDCLFFVVQFSHNTTHKSFKLCVPPFYRRRAIRRWSISVGIFEEATPYTLFALFALFALLACPQPAKAAWIHRIRVSSSNVNRNV